MQKLHYSISINAPIKKVWDTMLGDETYRQWTSAFNEGSYFKGNWEKDSKMLFLGPDPMSDKEGGMVSRVVENRPFTLTGVSATPLKRGEIAGHARENKSGYF